MTARGSEEIAMEALQVGATSYVPKRALAQRLVETVKRVMSARHDHLVQREVFRRLNTRRESFDLENDVELLLSLSRYLQSSLGQQWGLDLSTRLQVGQAIEEALLNAMYHGNLEMNPGQKEEDYQAYHDEADRRAQSAPFADRRIAVDVELNPTSVSYTIRDDGPGFDLSRLPTEAALEDLDRPCGRGVTLMRAFMDAVDYNDRGNQVTLRKSRID
jgi:anti-sigma regulatory factor (Ser/Thr protein kinase)